MGAIRKQAEIVQLGKQEVIDTGQLNVGLVCRYIMDNGANEWIDIGDIARFVYHRPYKDNKTRVRRSVGILRKALIDLGFILIAEGRPTERLKIAIRSSDYEMRLAADVVRKMGSRTDVSAATYTKAFSILNPCQVA